MDISGKVDKLELHLMALDRVSASLMLKELARDLTPRELIDFVVVPALERIGRNWETGSAALSQVYVGGVFMENFIDSLLPPADSLKHE